jgi:hypothetical protein
MNKKIPEVGFGTIELAREIVVYLGGDATIIKDNWCYPQLRKAFPELMEAYFSLIENATTGDPSYAAYAAGMYLEMPKERVFSVIENATTGDPAYTACWAGIKLGMPRERVFSVIENATTGDPAYAACWACIKLGMPMGRVSKVLEKLVKKGDTV